MTVGVMMPVRFAAKLVTEAVSATASLGAISEAVAHDDEAMPCTKNAVVKIAMQIQSESV